LTQEGLAGYCAIGRPIVHSSLLKSFPPQKITVMVQLFAGVCGKVAVAADAGYTLTASGMSSRLYSIMFL